MTILIIDNSVRECIKNLIVYAEDNTIRFDRLLETTAGDNANFVCFLPGYRCVYSVEEQSSKSVFKHLSVSVYPSLKNKLPSIDAVKIIMFEFGFPLNFEQVDKVWIEYLNKVPIAINVLKKKL
jgi:hypothetical protein